SPWSMTHLVLIHTLLLRRRNNEKVPKKGDNHHPRRCRKSRGVSGSPGGAISTGTSVSDRALKTRTSLRWGECQQPRRRPSPSTIARVHQRWLCSNLVPVHPSGQGDSGKISNREKSCPGSPLWCAGKEIGRITCRGRLTMLNKLKGTVGD